MALGFAKTLKRTFGLNPVIQSPSDSDWKLVTQILTRSSQLEPLTDHDLTSAATQLRESVSLRIGRTPALDNQTLIEGCALVRDAVRRVTGKEYFQVQILAGLTLSRGCVAEMATGEGKTLTSAIPAFMHSLQYPGVHVATPNAYLARRDFEELRGVYELLGLTAGLLPEKHDTAQARTAYQSHVTYGAGYAFGFDFLRDELTRRQQPSLRLGQETVLSIRGHRMQQVTTLQSGHWCSLIDEIDSVLLDEALTPLILSVGSQPTLGDSQLFRLARLLAVAFERGRDFQISTGHGRVQLTSAGIEQSERALTSPSLHGFDANLNFRAELKRPWSTYVENALQARYIFRPDVDYVVRDGEIQIVDQKTGRIFSDRSWRGGLHQAVEEYAGVRLSDEKASVGRITRQSYYKLYRSLCGMTGTAAGAEAEFNGIYNLPTVRIPLNRPSQRIHFPDRYFCDLESKFNAVVLQAAERHAQQQPILIGTRTISDSEQISSLLTARRIAHVVLNGKQDQEESEIVAEAGHAGRVTVATNMAGRGTDIKPDQKSIAAGGLHVICVERHESRRIDNQLAGRAARAGAPGSCQFYVSADDELVAHHAPKLATRLRSTADATGECRQNFDAAIRQLQTEREHSAYETRNLMMRQDRDMHELLSSLCYRSDRQCET